MTSATTTTPPQPLPADAGPLGAGRYRTAALQPALQFTVDNGWATSNSEAADVLALNRTAGGATGTELTFVALKRVFLRDRTYQTPADYVAPAGNEAVPTYLVEWLQQHPRLRVSKPEATSVGGVDAVRVDVETASPYPSEVCTGPCVALFKLDAAPGKYRLVKLDQGKTMRLYIAKVSGSTVVLSIVAPTEAMGAATLIAETVIRTVDFPR